MTKAISKVVPVSEYFFSLRYIYKKRRAKQDTNSYKILICSVTAAIIVQGTSLSPSSQEAGEGSFISETPDRGGGLHCKDSEPNGLVLQLK